MVNPVTNFNYILKNQARMIKVLPDLHAMGLKRYLDRFETCFTDSIMLAKTILDNNNCIAYLKNELRDSEKSVKQAEREATEDIALVRINTKRQLSILESKLQKMAQKTNSDQVTIGALKQENDRLKAEHDAMVVNLNKSMRDVVSFIQMHAQLLASENSIIQQSESDGALASKTFVEFYRKFSNDLRTEVSLLAGDLRDVKGELVKEIRTLEVLNEESRRVDKEERGLARAEENSFKTGLENAFALVKAEHSSIEGCIVDIKLFIDQLGRNSDQIAQDFEKEVNRFVSLNKLKEDVQM